MLSLFPTKQVFTFEFPHQVVGLLYVIMMDLSNLEVYMNAIPYIFKLSVAKVGLDFTFLCESSSILQVCWSNLFMRETSVSEY